MCNQSISPLPAVNMVKLSLGIVLLCAVSACAQTQYGLLDGVLQSFMKEQNLPGCSLVVNKDSQRVYSKGYGVADKVTRAAIDPDVSLFRVASISKTFTSAAIMLLVEEGKLSLSDKVFGTNGHLSQYTSFTDTRLGQITIQNLLQHTGGWDRQKSGDPMDNSPPKRLYSTIARQMGSATPMTNDVFINWLIKQRLHNNPGTTFAYSNVGFMLLSEIISKVSGKNYEEFIKTYLINIGVTDMKLGKTTEAQRATNEVKYYYNPETSRTQSIFPGEGIVSPCYSDVPLENALGAGAWIASMGDLVKFIHAISGTGGVSIFKNANSFNTMKQKPSYRTDQSDQWYGMGLTVDKQGLKYGHDGLFPGARAIMSHDHTGYNFACTCNGLPRDMDLDAVIRYALSLEKSLLPNYFTVKNNNFDSITKNGKYAVKTMIKEHELTSVINSVRPLGYRLSRIEAVQVGGKGMQGMNGIFNPFGPQIDPSLQTGQVSSLSYQIYYNTIWVKDGNTNYVVESGLSHQALMMRLHQLQFSRGSGIQYVTTYTDSAGQPRTTLVTGPVSSGWRLLAGVPFQQHNYQCNLLYQQTRMKMVTQSVHIVNGQPFVTSLHSSTHQFVSFFKNAISFEQYIKDVQAGLTPIHLNVSPDNRGFPVFHVIYTQGVKGKPVSQMSQYKLKVSLMEESMDDLMPITIAGFEVQGNIVFEGVWIPQ